MKKSAILCVDDEQVVLTSLMDQLIHYVGDDYSIEVAESGEEALEVLKELLEDGVEVPLIISDQIMPGMKGDELLTEVHQRYPQALKIFLTGQADANAVGNAVNSANLYRYITKPWDEADLKLTVAEALHSYTQDKQLTAQQKLLEDALEQERLAKEALRKANEELELRIQERTRELEAANKELEAFSYSVSHDLRAPLRAISGFSQILVDEYAPNLDDEGIRLINIITRNTTTMGMLIDDLLRFSRMSRREMESTVIDMNSLVAEVIQQHKEFISLKAFQFKPGNIPRAYGDMSMIRVVLMNLLSNASKFSTSEKQPVVEIGGRVDTSENVYFVKDNGVGFDMKYADKLFGVFQRLHSSEEFEGTGVGLALVQRIIHRHGGRVWAEGEVHKGATFYFTLPVVKE